MQKAGIVMLSVVVLGGVAPAVAPSVLNLNGGVVHAAEETHKVTIHYDLYDDPMFLLRSSSSSKVVDVTPNQPLSEHIPETLPGGYVFADAGANSGGSEGGRLSSRNDLFGNWTDIYVGYNLKLKKSRTNPSNAGTNNNEKPHKVTIFYCPFDGYPRVTTKKVVDVTPNQPLSEHIPETLPGGYVFADAIANGGGSEGGVSLSSRNDLFGNETAFYVHYLPKNTNSGNNNSNAEENTVGVYYHFEGEKETGGKVNIAENPNATVGDYYPLSKDGADLEYITDSKTMFWVYKISADGTYKVDNRGKLLSKYANSNLLGVYTKPKNADANAGANNNAGTEVKPNNDGNTNAGANNNAGTEVKPNNAEETHKVTIFYRTFSDLTHKADGGGSKVVDVTPNQPLSDHIPGILPGGYVFFVAGANVGGGGVGPGSLLRSRNDLFGNWAYIDARYFLKLKNAGTNAGTNNNAGTEVKPNNDGKTTAASTPKTSNQSTPNQRDGWSGSSYYQNGMKVTSKWIFDKNYNSYFYLDASGNYVQNAWVGNYYLKSGGYMAKSEWIYDNNYKSYYYLTAEGSYARNAWAGSYYLKSDGKMAKSEWIYDSSYKSYYYLTSEGSYARNTWVGDYYLKSNGKMAVNERTPDGYQVDASGKWVK